jgi:Glycosyltransferase family 87
MDRRLLRWDGPLYVAGAIVAAVAALSDRIPLQREWGRIAFIPYTVGAALAILLFAWRGGRLPGQHVRRARAAVVVVVVAGGALLPTALEVWWRARDGFEGHVQSEVLVTEGSARALLAGSDPYAGSFSGPLSTWPPGTADHVPYLPAMFAFGLPRALVGAGSSTDARVAFAVVSMAALATALWLARPPPARGLTALLVVLALPTGARYMAGGGDDVTVLSMMLLSLVFLHRRKPAAAGLAAGLAAAIKQTAWPLLPFLILAARDRDGRRASGRTLASASAVMVPFIAPFVLWNPSAFFQDVVLFPLGLSRDPTLAASPTPGSLLASALSLPKGIVAGILLLIVLLVAGYLALVGPPRDARGAAERTALVMVLAIMLATAGRFGYLLYPIGLLAWARLVLVRDTSPPNRDTRAIRLLYPGGCPSGQRERSVKSPA